jgi:hypothetical protein
MSRALYFDPMRGPIALLMMLWLPLQGLAAVAMPFCQHGMHGQAVTNSEAAPHAHHAHVVGTTPASPQPHGGNGGFDCNDCGVCHLACTPAAPSDSLAIHLVAGHLYGEPALWSAPWFIPEPPHHPPLRVLA